VRVRFWGLSFGLVPLRLSARVISLRVMPSKPHLRTLIYKRTHPGDPDAFGRFGIEDCMGQVRAWNFEAVIGVGGIGTQASSNRIDARVNWIGIGPHKHASPGMRGPIITFDRFVLFESAGPTFAGVAPRLARRLFDRNVRVLIHDVDEHERAEVAEILALAAKAPPSTKAAPRLSRSINNCRTPRCISSK